MNRMTTILVAAAIGMGGCGEAEMEEVPETAEVEAEPLEGELELDEELVLGLDDVGETIMATGWVIGAPVANGFFLRTEANRAIFVASDAQVSIGQAVRVTGPLVATDVAVFEGWEAEAFGTELEPEWDMETALFIDAISVTPIGAAP